MEIISSEVEHDNNGNNPNTEKLLEKCRKIVIDNPPNKNPFANCKRDYKKKFCYILYLRNGPKLIEVKKYHMIKEIIEDLGIAKSHGYKLSRKEGRYSEFFKIAKYEDPTVPIYDE